MGQILEIGPKRLRELLTALLMASSACSSDHANSLDVGEPAADSGTQVDSGTGGGDGAEGADAGAADVGEAVTVCDATDRWEPRVGATLNVSGDSKTTLQPVVAGCWEGHRTQWATSILIPGTGDVGVEAIVISTSDNEDHWPLIEWRRGCETPADGDLYYTTCGDITEPPETAEAREHWTGLVAQGGEVIHFIVSDVNDLGGFYQLSVTINGINPPEITSARGVIGPDRPRLFLQGTDLDENAYGVLVRLFDAAGEEIVPVGGRSPMRIPFELWGAQSQSPFSSPVLLPADLPATPVSAEVSILDLTRLASDPVTFDFE